MNQFPSSIVKNLKNFLSQNIFHLSTVSLTLVINLLPPRIFVKIEVVPKEYSGAGGKMIHEKYLKSKFSSQTLFNYKINEIK
jgi:hypothetical protein